MSAALSQKIFPPLFNLYEGGESFGFHIDNAIRPIKGTQERVRTDLSMPLFFSEPDTSAGGELVVQDTFGSHEVNLSEGRSEERRGGKGCVSSLRSRWPPENLKTKTE